jgi:hypothetical protein
MLSMMAITRRGKLAQRFAVFLLLCAAGLVPGRNI